MGPKAAAAGRFVRATGGIAAIRALADAPSILEGRAGTGIIQDPNKPAKSARAYLGFNYLAVASLEWTSTSGWGWAGGLDPLRVLFERVCGFTGCVRCRSARTVTRSPPPPGHDHQLNVDYSAAPGR